MYKVRFHLAKGVNFEKWQITDLDTKEVNYYDPLMVSLNLTKCKLKNSKATANKIYCGQNKTVCAWIECEEVVIDFLVKRYEDYREYTDYNFKSVEPISYNPKTHPYWVNSIGTDIDGNTYGGLKSINRQVFIYGARTENELYVNLLKDQICYWEKEVSRRRDNKDSTEWQITLAERKVKALQKQLVK